MAENDESITIEKCPLCGTTHRYSLKVQTGIVMYNILSMRDVPPPKVRTFVRFFACPVKGQDYRATFRLLESPSAPIESVDVAGEARD